jgi:hypothetical protein
LQVHFLQLAVIKLSTQAKEYQNVVGECHSLNQLQLPVQKTLDMQKTHI